MKTAFLLSALLLAPLSAPAFADDAPAAPAAPAGGRIHVGGARPIEAERELVDATYLGLSAVPLGIERAADLKIAEGAGLVVVEVAPDSPAAKAGVQKGDVLHHLDDQLLVNPGQLKVLIRARKAGDKVALVGTRKGDALKLTATLGGTKAPRITPGGEEPRFRIQPFPGGHGQAGGGEGAEAQILPLGPDGFGPLPEGLPDGIREELQRMLGEARLIGPGPAGGGGGQLQVGPGGAIRSNMSFNDGEHTIKVARGGEDGDLLTITGQDGKQVYSGAIPQSDAEWNNVPEAVREKARKFAGNQDRVQLRLHAIPFPGGAQLHVEEVDDGEAAEGAAEGAAEAR